MAQITAGRVKQAEFARNVWVAVAPHGETLESALNPAWWAGVASQFKMWDRIELRAEDGSWFAELVVVAASRLAVDARVIGHTEFDAQPTVVAPSDPDALPSGYDVNFGGPVHKYRVVRKADGEVMAHGMSKKDATAWAWDYVNAGTAKANAAVA